MKYSIELTTDGGLAVTINGKKFHKEGHRWQDEKGGSAQNYRDPLEDLVLACARYEKIYKRLESQSVTPALETSEPTVTKTGVFSKIAEIFKSDETKS